MFRLSQFAAPAVLGIGLAVGAIGCADRHPYVPSDAVILKDGKHTLDATAPTRGTVYVYDDSTHKLIYSGPVAHGDNIEVNPTTDKVMINGKVVSQQELDNDHKFKIYLEQDLHDRNLNDRDVSVHDRDLNNTDVNTNVGPGDRTVIKERTVVKEHQPE